MRITNVCFLFILLSLLFFFNTQAQTGLPVKKIQITLSDDFGIKQIPPEDNILALSVAIELHNAVEMALDSLQNELGFTYTSEPSDSLPTLFLDTHLIYGFNDGIKTWKTTRYSFFSFIVDDFSNDTLTELSMSIAEEENYDALDRLVYFAKDQAWILRHIRLFINHIITPHTYRFEYEIDKPDLPTVSINQYFEPCDQDLFPIAETITELVANMLAYRCNTNYRERLNFQRTYLDSQNDNSKTDLDVEINARLCNKTDKYEFSIDFIGKNVNLDLLEKDGPVKQHFLFDKARIDRGDFTEVIVELNKSLNSFLVQNFL